MTLVQPANGAVDNVTVDREAVLKALNLNPRDPSVQALVLVCQQYGLDPVLKHAVLIKGNLYVTRDGLLSVAHRSGQLDGIVVEDEGETDAEWWAKVAVYVKGQTHPYSYRGRYPKNGHQKQYGPEMAVKCAEVMALRRAFGVTGIATVEEQWDKSDALAAEARPAVEAVPAVREVAMPAPDDGPNYDELVPSFVDPPTGVDGQPKVKAKGSGAKRSGAQVSMYARIKDGWPDAKQAELDERRHALISFASGGKTQSSLEADDDLCRAVEMLVDECVEATGAHDLVLRASGGYEVRPKGAAGSLDEVPVEAEIVDDALAELREVIGQVPGLGEGRVLKRARRVAEDNGWPLPDSFEAISGPVLDEVYAEALAKLDEVD